MLDGATNITSTLSVGAGPVSIAVNQVTNKIYVANRNSDNITVIDGATNSTSTVNVGTVPFAATVNPVTNKIYVANFTSDSVTVITEQTIQPVPLLVNIAALPGNRSFSSTPTFTFTPNSNYVPYAPNPQQVYYQLDTWQNAWTAATPAGDGVSWKATLAPIQHGVHIIYAWAGDGSEATSINRPRRLSPSSPIIGRISAYLFVADSQFNMFLPLLLK